MNFSDKTFEALAPFERYFKTATEADWCPNPGRAALDAMAEALTEKDGRRTAVNHACGSCILRVVKRTGYLWFEDKAQREAAAEQLGRKCYMMELDPHYCDVIIARWEKLTGKKAIKIAG